MSSERRVDPLAALILVLSIIGLIMVAALNFAGLYYENYYSGDRFAHWDSEYSTSGTVAAQACIVIFLIIQIIIVINDLVPNRIIEMDLDKVGLLFAGLTFLLAIIGIASFGGYYGDDYDWWPSEGFYAGIIAGLLNMILFFLKTRYK